MTTLCQTGLAPRATCHDDAVDLVETLLPGIGIRYELKTRAGLLLGIVVRREGAAVTVLAYGTMVHVAMAAAADTEVDAEIIDLRTLLPLDLEAIEASDYATLPSSTYAVGFAKAYARAVGADEVRVANLVRAELGKIVRRTPEYEPYEMSDPSRVPSRGVAVIALGIAMMLQPFALVLYTWSFVTTLAGVAMFTIVSKFPR